MPICFLSPAFVGKLSEGQKTDRATRDDHCDSKQRPNSGLSSDFGPQLPSVLASWRSTRCLGLAGTSHMTDGAAVLLIDILLSCRAGRGP